MPKHLTKDELLSYFKDLAENRKHTLQENDSNILTKKKSQLTIRCNRCNSIFHTTGYNYIRGGGKKTEKNFIKEENNHFFLYGCPCCKKIYKKKCITFPSGEKHSQWKGGIATKKREGYTQYQYNTWREGVFKLYKGKCFLTKLKNRQKLQSHHLDSWFTSPEKRYEFSNGVLLDASIHAKFHSIYRSETTREQFEEFCKKYYNIHIFPWITFKKNINTMQKNQKKKQLINQQKMRPKGDSRNYKLISGMYENKNSKYIIYCPKHNVPHETTAYNFKRAVYGIPCCNESSPNKKKPPNQTGLKRSLETLAKKKKTENECCEKQIKNLAQERFHTILIGTFKNTKSLFQIYCNLHDKTQTISYHNYCRNKFGLQCCCKK